MVQSSDPRFQAFSWQPTFMIHFVMQIVRPSTKQGEHTEQLDGALLGLPSTDDNRILSMNRT
jgi:hypothetical protein